MRWVHSAHPVDSPELCWLWAQPEQLVLHTESYGSPHMMATEFATYTAATNALCPQHGCFTISKVHWKNFTENAATRPHDLRASNEQPSSKCIRTFFIFCTSNSDVVYAKFLGFFTNFAACLRPFMNLRRLPSWTFTGFTFLRSNVEPQSGLSCS